jgi:F0F1-type ATP synthase assembly protein I
MIKKDTTSDSNKQTQFVFGKSNYRLLIISIVVVCLGFFLMSGTTDIYNATKTILAPIVVLLGFTIGFFAILKKNN